MQRVDFLGLLVQLLLTVLVEILHDHCLDAAQVLYPVVHTLEHRQFRIAQLIVGQFCLSRHNQVLGHFLSNQHHLDGLVGIIDFPVQHLRIRELQFVRNEVIRRSLIKGFTHDVVRQINRRTHGTDGNPDDVTLHHLLPFLVDKLFPLEVHETDPQEGSQADKYGIDEIQVEGPQEIQQIPRSQSETGRTQRRHQSRSDSHTRNHIPFLLGSKGYDTCQTTEQGDKHIVDGRRGTGQQLRLHLIQRREEEIQGGRHHTEESSHQETLQRTLHQFEVVLPDGKSHTHYRPHQWRNQHGTDNHRCRIEIQS